MKFIDSFEAKVKKTIKDFNLISPDDKVIVAYSGGKDSTTVLYLLNKLGCKVEALMINLLIGDYSKKHLQNAEAFCKDLGVKFHVINMNDELGKTVCSIQSIIQSKINLSNCHICGSIKRWLLNKKARELGASKLATGHNLDDESETLLMNLFGGNPKLLLGGGPKNGLINDKKFVQRIKPLYFLTNDEVSRYSELNHLPVFDKPCPCAGNALRTKVRLNLKKVQEKEPKVKVNLMNNFLKMIPLFKEAYYSKGELNYCKNCGEPSRNELCKHCELISNI